MRGSEEWFELLAWVKATERRVDILTALQESPRNTGDFAEQWDISPEAVRYHLQQMEKGGPEGEYPALVEVLTPDRHQYKLYGSTEMGTKVANAL